MKTLLDKLLEYYHISYDEYLYKTRDVSIEDFYLGHAFDNAEESIKLVKEVMAENGKIIVYGDYDCDGVMGTSILVKMFQYLDHVSAFYIPNRYIDGYGINLENAKKIVDAKYDLLIAVDNGISAFEAISYLKDNGVKVIVLDHHQVQDNIVPNADYIWHPTYSHFGDTASSGAFVAFLFSIALLGRVDKYLSILAAISLISDMMPLSDYNRDLLRAVFKEYKPGEFLAIDLLADHEKIDETVIGMRIAPRINSIGRLSEDFNINQIVNYFTSNNEKFVLNYFAHILDINEQRKQISKGSYIEIKMSEDDKALIILGDYKEGIIGLLANSLVSKYHVPSIVFTKTSDGLLKGSARAIEGFDIVKAFSKLTHLLETYGGHALAGGCSLKEDNFEQFKREFLELVKLTPLEYEEKPTVDLSFSEVTMEGYELISSFGPFGESWEMPVFKLSHIKTDTLTYSKDEMHIISRVGNTLKIVGFNLNKEKVSEHKYINLLGNLRINNFRGTTYLEFNANKFEPY